MICAVDLSGIFWAHWMSQKDGDPVSSARDWTVRKVRALAEEFEHVGIACDSRENWRKAISPRYKAQRAERGPEAWAQLEHTIETLAREGFAVWKVEGYEADDILATVAYHATRAEHPRSVTIVSGDKDLLQCIRDGSPGVQVLTPGGQHGPPRTIDATTCAIGKRKNEAGDIVPLLLPPRLVRDFLALVGDGSDNVPGVKGIGPIKALNLLQTYKSFPGVIAALEAGDAALVASQSGKLLAEHKADALMSWALVELRTDALVEWTDALKPRVMEAVPSPNRDASFCDDGEAGDGPADDSCADQSSRKAAPPSDTTAGVSAAELNGHMALEKRRDDILTTREPVSWAMQLEPTNSGGAWQLSKILADARMFPDLKTAEQVLAAVLLGRMHGIPAIAACMNCFPIKGRMSMSAAMLIGIVQKRADVCDYIECVATSDTASTWIARRRGRPEVSLTFTAAQAQRAGYVSQGGMYSKDPEAMLRWRAGTRLARMVFPDVVAGLYSREEMEDSE